MPILLADADVEWLATDLSKRLAVTKEEAVRHALLHSLAELEKEKSTAFTRFPDGEDREKEDFVRRGLAHGQELRSRMKAISAEPLDRRFIDELYEG